MFNSSVIALPDARNNSSVFSTNNGNAEFIPAGAPDYAGAWKTKIFNIDEKPLFVEGSEIQVPNKKALLVNGKVINIVSDKYKVVQPSDVMRSFERTTDLTIDAVLSNTHTGGLLIKSRMMNPTINGEKHSIDLTFYTGHNGQYRTILSLQALRMLCMNQIPAISKNENLWLMNEKHYRDFDLQKMESLMDQAGHALIEWKQEYTGLLDIPLTARQFIELWQEETKATDKAVQKMADIYQFADGQSHLGESVYKAYQAITYDLSHGRNSKIKMEKENINNMATAKDWLTKLFEAA